MTATGARSSDLSSEASVRKLEMKLEVVVLPVADVDRAATFYEGLGWRKDADIKAGPSRRLQFTPPGSACSILFGTHLTPSPPGSAQFVHLVVSDIVAARDELARNGADPSEVFHDAAGGYDRFDPRARASGPDPQRRSYASFATFKDPDGNLWVVQEITQRLPGRVDSAATTFATASDLASAMRRAAAAHGEHEKRIGKPDANWPDWYAAFMVAERSGNAPPA